MDNVIRVETERFRRIRFARRDAADLFAGGAELFLRETAAMAASPEEPVPLGSSDPRVAEFAGKGLRNGGASWLMNNCKAHFRTTDKVLAACGMTRDDLPPEGRVESKTVAKV